MSSPPLEPDSPSDQLNAGPKPPGCRGHGSATTAALVEHWFAVAATWVFGIVTPTLILITGLWELSPFDLRLIWIVPIVGSLALWMVLGRQLQKVSAELAGVFLAGALLAWLATVTTSPLLLLLIDFDPVFVSSIWPVPTIPVTGFVYFFRAREVAALARERHSIWGLLWRMLLSASLVIAFFQMLIQI